MVLCLAGLKKSLLFDLSERRVEDPIRMGR